MSFVAVLSLQKHNSSFQQNFKFLDVLTWNVHASVGKVITHFNYQTFYQPFQ